MQRNQTKSYNKKAPAITEAIQSLIKVNAMQKYEKLQDFQFECPLIIQYPVDGKIKTTNNGSIIITGKCFEDWLGLPDTKDVVRVQGKGTSLENVLDFIDQVGIGAIDRAIQQHIEGLLRGDFSYDTSTDQQQDLPDISGAIANVINPAA